MKLGNDFFVQGLTFFSVMSQFELFLSTAVEGSLFFFVFFFRSPPAADLQEVTQGTQRTTRNTKIFIYDRISIAISSSRSSKSIFLCVPCFKSLPSADLQDVTQGTRRTTRNTGKCIFQSNSDFIGVKREFTRITSINAN